MPPQTVGADSLPSEPVELLQRLRQKSKLWTYVAPSGQTTYDSVIAAIDGDSRVGRGEFVAGIVANAIKEGAAIGGHFDTLVCTGPGAFRNLREMPILTSGVRVSAPGRLHLLPWPEAERVWIHLLANDAGVATFVEAGLGGGAARADLSVLFNDPKRMLRGWHRSAIEQAVRVANAHDVPLSPMILFTTFLNVALQRDRANTLYFLGRRLFELRSAEGLINLFQLQHELRTLDPSPRELVVTPETAGVINAFMNSAHLVRKDTDGTEDIRTRHVATAFVMHPMIANHLSRIDFVVANLRRAVYEFIVATVPGAEHRRWRVALDIRDDTSSTSPRKARTKAQRPPQPAPAPEPTSAPREFSIDTIVSRDTWTTEDNLGYSLYAQAITASILNGTTEPPLTIGIQAPWGQGKTSLMRMMQDELDPGAPYRDRVAPSLSTVRTAIQTTYARLLAWSWKRSAPKDPGDGLLNENRQELPDDWPADPQRKPPDASDTRPRIPTVWFNPLYYRETQQVWAGMAHAILQQLSERFKDPIAKEKFWFRLQQSRLNIAAVRRDIHAWVLMRLVPTGFLLVAVAAITALAIALSPASVVWLLKAAGGVTAAGTLIRFLIEFVRKIDRPFERYVTEPNYQSDLGPLHLIDHDLDRALRLLVGDKPIAVFIDDLDRCDPQTVNQVILAINQFLSLPRRNVFFILGMDMEMVAAALEQAQKEQLGAAIAQRRSFGWRFMEKFVQLPFFIPHLDAGVAQRFAESHLGGVRHAPVAAAAAPEVVEEAKKKVAEASTPSAVGEAMAEAAKALPPQEQATLQKEASNKVAELMKTNDSEEMKEIARIAVQDLDLNPRTIVRYFGLVRVLRNIQVSTGNVTSPEADRTLVLRAAHLLMNWPQFVQWLRNEPEIHTTAGAWKPTVEEVERLAGSQSIKRWQQGIAAMLRRDVAPQHLADPSLYRFLRRIADDPPGLKAMYDARMF